MYAGEEIAELNAALADDEAKLDKLKDFLLGSSSSGALALFPCVSQHVKILGPNSRKNITSSFEGVT